MVVLLHLSDLHFGTEQVPVGRALLALAHRLQPTVVVVSGDITQRATQNQYDLAAALLHDMPPARWLVLPGNHDLPLWNPWLRLTQPYARYRALRAQLPTSGSVFEVGAAAPRTGPRGEDALDLPGLQLTAVDTTRAWRHQYGAISHRQIEHVATRLQQAQAGSLRIVVTHHPLVVAPGGDPLDRPFRHREAIQRWCAAGLDLVLSGHTHVAGWLPLATSTARSAAGWQVNAGSSLSRRLPPGAVNTVGVLRMSGAGGADAKGWQRWGYRQEEGAFVPMPDLPAGQALAATVRGGAATQ